MSVRDRPLTRRYADQLLEKLTYFELMENVPDTPFVWTPDNSNEANARVEWIQRQPKVVAFKASNKSEALILECDEGNEGHISPMTRVAQLYCEHLAKYENVLPIYYWAHGLRTYNPFEAVAWMSGKVLLEGFDPYVAVPAKPDGRPIGMLANLIESHRRRTPVIVVMDSLGLYDDAPDFAKDWRLTVQRFVDMAKSNKPDLKPFKLLIINPMKSKVINKIRKANPEVLVMNCPTVKGSMPPQ